MDVAVGIWLTATQAFRDPKAETQEKMDILAMTVFQDCVH